MTSTPINCRLPDELLIMALANLAPEELRQCGLVCKRWQKVINDDSCWRLALEVFMGCLPLREWKAGGKRVVQFDPRVGRISSMLIDYDDDRMYVGSLDKGVVVVANPNTGKVDKDHVYFNENLEALPISALLLERARILAGHLTGHITMVTQFISKPSISHSITHSLGFHDGSVTVLATLPNLPNIVLSGGSDGIIYAWDIATFACVCAFVGCTSSIKFASFDSKNCVIACGENGNIYIWTVDLSSTKEKSNSPKAEYLPSKILSHNIDPNETPEILTFIHDLSSTTFLTGANSAIPYALMLWSCHTGENVALFRHPSSVSISSTIANLTSAVWDRPSLPPSPISSTTPPATSLVVSAHSDSSVLFWSIPESVFQRQPGSVPAIIAPHRKIQVTVSSPISTLTLDPFKLLISTTDGLIKGYDSTTGQHIKTMSVRKGGDPIFPPIDPDDRRRVTCVWGGEWNLIASTAGGHVRNWDFGPVVGNGADREWVPGRFKKKNRAGKYRFVPNGQGTPTIASNNGASTASRTSLSGRPSTSKMQFAMDMKDEWKATSLELKMERERDEKRRWENAKLNGILSPPSSSSFGVPGTGKVLGAVPGSKGVISSSKAVPPPMTEQEMIDYAIMLSMEESSGFSLGESAYISSESLELEGKSILGTQESTAKTVVKATKPILDEGSIFTSDTGETNSNASLAESPTKSSNHKSPSSPWSTGKSFASVVASKYQTTSSSSTKSLPNSSTSSVVAFSESVTPKLWNTRELAASQAYRQSWFPTPWYENDEDWEDEREFYKLSEMDTAIYTPTKRRSSLSLSLATVLPSTPQANLEANGMEFGKEDSAGTGSLADMNKIPLSGRPSSLSTSVNSLEKKKYLMGSSMGSNSGPDSPVGLIGAGLHLRRSPRLGPMGAHVSPRIGPMAMSPSLAPTTSYSGVGVQVAPRASLDDEDEELMYVLELSLRDK